MRRRGPVTASILAAGVIALGVAFLVQAPVRVSIEEAWLLFRLRSSDEKAWEPAARRLAELRSERAIPRLVQIGRDMERSNQNGDWIFESLIAIGPAGIEEIFRNWVKDDAEIPHEIKTKILSLKEAAVPGLTRVLEKGDPVPRCAALLLLAEMKSEAKEAGPAVVSLLDSDDPRVQERAIAAIEPLEIPRDLAAPKLLKILRAETDPGLELLQGAVDALDQLGERPPEALPVVRAALRQSDGRSKEFGARLIGKFGPLEKDDAAILFRFSQREGIGFFDLAEVACATLLSQAKHLAEFLPKLRELAVDSEAPPKSRKTAIECLRELGMAAAAALPEIRKAVGDEDGEVSEAATGLLLDLAGEDPGLRAAAVPGLLRLLIRGVEKAPGRERTVVDELIDLGDLAQPQLLEAASSTSVTLRGRALLVLARRTKPLDALLAGLGRGLADPDDDVREAVQLAQKGGVDTTPLLQEFLQHQDLSARVNAASLLGEAARGDGIDHPELIPPLREGLHSNVHHLAWWAATGAKALGERARPLVPDLSALLEGEDRKLREYAKSALGAIGPAARPASPAGSSR